MPDFANSYAEFLTVMTDPKGPTDDRFFSFSIEMKRLVSQIPDMFSVVDTLSRTGSAPDPNINVYDFKKEIEKNLLFTKYKEELSDINWQDLFRESYNLYFIYMNAAQHGAGRNETNAMRIIREVANPMIKNAGMIAAYQDVLTYVLTTTLYVDPETGNSPSDPWEDWKNVSGFHNAVFDADNFKRQAHYVSRLD